MRIRIKISPGTNHRPRPVKPEGDNREEQVDYPNPEVLVRVTGKGESKRLKRQSMSGFPRSGLLSVRDVRLRIAWRLRFIVFHVRWHWGNKNFFAWCKFRTRASSPFARTGHGKYTECCKRSLPAWNGNLMNPATLL